MFIKRKILPLLEKYLEYPEAIVLTGFRRVGKSTLVKYLFDNLKTSNKLFLDMESPVNQKIFQEENYDAITTKFKELGLNIKGKSYIFMDEIQFVKDTPSIVKYLFDHYKIKFVFTGSSSFYLKNYFTESLSGRKFIFELMPLTFEEFLWFRGEKVTVSANYDLLRHLYDEYMNFGGLPGVVLESTIEAKNLKLDDALGSYFQLDVANLSTFRDIKILKSLLFLLASRVGSKLDISKLSESLGVSRQSLYNYLEFFEQTYLIHLAPAYSNSSDIIIRKNPKLYFSDSGLLNRIDKVSTGQTFENTIFNQLFISDYFKRETKIFVPRVSYFQKKSGAEIDFISANVGYEVKLTGTSNDVRRVNKFASNLKLDSSYVISLEKPKFKTQGVVYPFKI